jgi:hypothetical protein
MFMLAIPVVVAAAFVHGALQAVAPSNMLIRRVRRARPSCTAGAGLVVLALLLLVAIRLLTSAISSGAPGWLNLFVLVLAWDATRFVLLGVSIVLSSGLRAARVVARS